MAARKHNPLPPRAVIVQSLDLAVVIPDRHWAAVVDALLQRHQSLNIRPNVQFELRNQTIGRDGALRKFGVDLARVELRRAAKVIVIFDYAGCGDERSAAEIQLEMQVNLDASDPGRARVLVVEPELETWLIGGHAALRHLDGLETLDARAWWLGKGHWPDGQAKPTDPKRAMESLFLEHRLHYSAANLRVLAERGSLSVDRCKCESYREFVATLRAWFPA